MRKSLAMIAAVGLLGMTAGNLKADAAATPTPTPWYAKVAVSGYIDADYEYNFNGENSTQGRSFDTTANQFTVDAAKLGLVWADAPSGTGAELDLLYGPNAAVINGASGGAATAADIEQAFVTKAFGPVTFKLGKFGTFLGTEVTDNPGNMNYSRSILFGAIPYFHTGLMANYAVADGYALMGYIGDGDSADVSDSSADHDWGIQGTFTKVKNLSLILNYYEKTERGGGTTVNDEKYYGNLLASYTVMDSLSVAGEYLYETEVAPTITGVTPYTPKQQGYALYVDYTTPMAGLSIIPRYEQWWAVDGSATDPWNDLTLTLKYAMGPLTHYLEYRNDSTTPPIFSSGVAPTAKPSYMQNTLTYAVVYGF